MSGYITITPKYEPLDLDTMLKVPMALQEQREKQEEKLNAELDKLAAIKAMSDESTDYRLADYNNSVDQTIDALVNRKGTIGDAVALMNRAKSQYRDLMPIINAYEKKQKTKDMIDQIRAKDPTARFTILNDLESWITNPDSQDWWHFSGNDLYNEAIKSAEKISGDRIYEKGLKGAGYGLVKEYSAVGYTPEEQRRYAVLINRFNQNPNDTEAIKELNSTLYKQLFEDYTTKIQESLSNGTYADNDIAFGKDKILAGQLVGMDLKSDEKYHNNNLIGRSSSSRGRGTGSQKKSNKDWTKNTTQRTFAHLQPDDNAISKYRKLAFDVLSNKKVNFDYVKAMETLDNLVPILRSKPNNEGYTADMIPYVKRYITKVIKDSFNNNPNRNNYNDVSNYVDKYLSDQENFKKIIGYGLEDELNNTTDNNRKKAIKQQINSLYKKGIEYFNNETDDFYVIPVTTLEDKKQVLDKLDGGGIMESGSTITLTNNGKNINTKKQFRLKGIDPQKILNMEIHYNRSYNQVIVHTTYIDDKEKKQTMDISIDPDRITQGLRERINMARTSGPITSEDSKQADNEILDIIASSPIFQNVKAQKIETQTGDPIDEYSEEYLEDLDLDY